MDILIALFVAVHILALVAGASNGVIQMLTAPRLANATSDSRRVLYAVQDRAAAIGKVSMAVLIATGLIVLWFKWNFSAPNPWFWVKMGGLSAMLAFILLGEQQTANARGNGPLRASAIAAKALYGKLTSLAMLVVVFSAVMAFR